MPMVPGLQTGTGTGTGIRTETGTEIETGTGTGLLTGTGTGSKLLIPAEMGTGATRMTGETGNTAVTTSGSALTIMTVVQTGEREATATGDEVSASSMSALLALVGCI